MRSIILVFLITVAAVAFNHPHIKWKTVETERFRIHYYNRTEPVVYAVWKTADEVMEGLSDLYDYRSRGKINICIADYDDYSNGWADFLSGNIMIWVPDSRFEMRGNNTWLRNVVTHELVHILTLDKKHTSIFDVTFDASVLSGNSHLRIQEPFAYQSVFPSWLYEGVAQLETERMGHDCWDSRRDMVLRIASLEGKLLTLDQMGQFSHDSYGNEMVYNQGFSFAKYLYGQMGADKFRTMWAVASSRKTDPSKYIQSVSGRPLRQLYKEWADSVSQYYGNRKPKRVSVLETVWDRGFINSLPKISPDGRYTGWLTSCGDDANQTELRITDNSSGSAFTVPRVHTAWDFGAEDVFYVKSDQPSESGSFLNNLFRFSLETGKEKQLTRRGRFYGVAASPDGEKLACIRFSSAIYSVEEYDIGSGSFRKLYQGVPGEHISDLCYDPAGSGRIVFSRLISGMSRLFVLEKDKTVTALGPGISQEESPFWAENGRIYYSADYDGIFNVYSLDPEEKTDPVRHSTVIGGAFSPHLCSDGRVLVSSYGKTGFAIEKLTPDHEEFELGENQRCSFEPLPAVEGAVRIHSKPYRPVKLKSTREISFNLEYSKNTPLEVEPDSFSGALSGSFASFSSDALDKKSSMWSITAGLLGKSVQDTMEDFSSGLRNGIVELCPDPFEIRRGSEKSGIKRLLHSPEPNPSLTSGTAADNSEGPGGVQSAYLPFVMPSVGWRSNERSFTAGFSGSVVFAPSHYPEMFIQGNLYRDITSELSAGADLETYWVVLPVGPFPVSSSIPLNLTYVDQKKYDRYSRYNFSEITYLSLYGAPGHTFYSTGDTAVGITGLLGWGVQFQHGFPLGEHGSLVLHSANESQMSSVDLADSYDILSGESDLYFTSSSGVNLNVPLFMINSGSFWYADAVFARLGYSLFARGNRGVFEENFKAAMWTEPDFDLSKVGVGHYISGGLNVGIFKNAHYSRMLSLQLDYELLNEKMFFSLGLTF
ncbi:MAG: TolB family protein [Chitinispirillaceae bacterium]